MVHVVWPVVLISAGIELIFFLVAGTVLCFGFRMRIMLITHRCFSCCWAVLTLVKDFSASHALPARSWEGAQPGQLTQTGQRDIPYHVTSCSVYKLGGVSWEMVTAARELAGHWSVGGEQLRCASLILYILLSLLLLLFSLPFLSY